MKSSAEILKYAEQYAANRPYHVRMIKSKNPDAYFRSHESQLILYDGARNMLRKAGISLKSVDLEQMRAEYHAMEKEKAKLQRAYKSAEKESKDMEQKLQNLSQYLGRENETQREQKPQRQHPSL